jgi:prevent-host-death family protein
MSRVPNIIPVSDLRQDATGLLERVQSSREPTVLTHRGRAAAVLLSLAEFDRLERELEILSILARGEQEMQAGQGHDLDDVIAEADEILAP